MRTIRRCFPILALSLVAVFVGCTEHAANGTSETFSYSIFSSIGLFLAGIAAGVAGWMLRDSRFGLILLIGGPVAALVFAPGFFTDKVQVDDERIYIRTGMWFAPTVIDAKYSDLNAMSVSQEERSGRRGRRYTVEMLNFNTKSKGEQKVQISGLVEEAIKSIIIHAKEHDVNLINLLPG